MIYPGDYYASNGDCIITTLLGSCVAACLFDPVNRVMGMNHFLLSGEICKNGKNGFVTPSGRYGVQAMELLINRMYKMGAQRKHIKAKAFGGATLKGFSEIPNNWNSIGSNNVSFIKRFLDIEKIPLLAQDLGGNRGRTIYFVSTDFSVYVRKHEPVDLGNLYETEKQYSRKVSLEQNSMEDDISIWN